MHGRAHPISMDQHSMVFSCSLAAWVQQALGLDDAVSAVLVAFLLRQKFLLFRSWFGWGVWGNDVWFGGIGTTKIMQDPILASLGVAMLRPGSLARRRTLQHFTVRAAL